MGMKKMPVVLVACMLLFLTLDVLAIENSAGPAKCCFKFLTTRLPKDKVAKFQRTHLKCKHDGVLFTMKKGRQFCVDPAQKWVQDVITYVESRPSKQ